MSTPNERIQQLTAALEGLLMAKNVKGDSVFYDEVRGWSDQHNGDVADVHGDVVLMRMCRVCGGGDEHDADCAVKAAERLAGSPAS